MQTGDPLEIKQNKGVKQKRLTKIMSRVIKHQGKLTVIMQCNPDRAVHVFAPLLYNIDILLSASGCIITLRESYKQFGCPVGVCPNVVV